MQISHSLSIPADDRPHINAADQADQHPYNMEPSSPTGTFSTFSMTSTLEGRVFREDMGRRFQASNDEYSLPNDEPEMERLEHQHFGFKAAQNGSNYLVPLSDVLVDGTRALDIGCGTGIWALEMARDFPNVEWIGTDLAPIQKDVDLPNNLHFINNDVSEGLPFPDGYFDFVHVRFIVLGIRNWRFVVNEVIRVTRSGGMMVFVECGFPWPLINVPEEQWRSPAPGHCKFQDYLLIAVETRGYDPHAAERTIAALMRAHGAVKDVSQIHTFLPLWAWSEDPHLKRAGDIMLADAHEVPNSAKLLIMDACELPDSRYEELRAGFLNDLGRPGATSAMPVTHNYGWKL